MLLHALRTLPRYFLFWIISILTPLDSALGNPIKASRTVSTSLSRITLYKRMSKRLIICAETRYNSAYARLIKQVSDTGIILHETYFIPIQPLCPLENGAKWWSRFWVLCGLPSQRSGSNAVGLWYMDASRRYLEVFMQKAVLWTQVSLLSPGMIIIAWIELLAVITMLTPGFRVHFLYLNGWSAVKRERFGTSELMRSDSLIIAVWLEGSD